MAIEILMPALSPTMTEGTLAKWCKKKGDKVTAGDIIAEIETDKATMEVESIDDGIMGEVLVAEKTKNVKVNQLIAIVLEEGDKKEVINDIIAKHNIQNSNKQTVTEAEDNKQEEVPKEENIAASSAQPQSLALASEQKNSRIFASPLAKRIALQEGVNLHNVLGTGPRGRIIKENIINFMHAGKKAVARNNIEFSKKEISTIRQVVAQRLVESKQQVPHFYLSVHCVLDNLALVRQDINIAVAKNEDGKPIYKISINDFIIKALSLAIRDNPDVNCAWMGDHIVQYNNVDISVAVAIDDGLITPIIRNADQKDLITISNEMKALVVKAKNNSLSPEEFQGGSATISNLGMYNIPEFQAIINPPQSFIIAVGSTEKKVVHVDNDITIANIMTINMSCDHRVVDGAVAANLINNLKKYIEKPILMFI